MKWKRLERLLIALGKIRCKMKSSCCKSSCVLNAEENIDNNIYDETATNGQSIIRKDKEASI